MAKIRVLVADGQNLYCEGICALLESTGNIEVAARASNGDELLEKVKEQSPDVILIDAALPMTNGVEVARQLRGVNLSARVLLLVEYENEEDVLSGFRAGVNGVIPKRAGSADLISAISAVSRGDYFIHSSITRTMVRDYFHGEGLTGRPGHGRLTSRESQILKLIAQGSRTSDVASQLNIAPKTVAGHRSKMMRKLGIHSQTELVTYAIRHHLINLWNRSDEQRQRN
jgi:DNA-binding NarL/FixJ family response regulator